jgi:hypothetical protein
MKCLKQCIYDVLIKFGFIMLFKQQRQENV